MGISSQRLKLTSFLGVSNPIRRPHPLEPKATRSTCRGFRAVCGVSGRRAVSGLALLGAAASCANLLAVPMPVQAAMLEPDVIRYRKLDSGVKLEDVVDGEGPEAREGDLVQFNYVCRRANGYFVHSTVNQFSGESKPVTLRLDVQEVPGQDFSWQLTFLQMI
ncbi:hypothetical protein VPH35_110380 [Triticum aestivum]